MGKHQVLDEVVLKEDSAPASADLLAPQPVRRGGRGKNQRENFVGKAVDERASRRRHRRPRRRTLSALPRLHISNCFFSA